MVIPSCLFFFRGFFRGVSGPELSVLAVHRLVGERPIA